MIPLEHDPIAAEESEKPALQKMKEILDSSVHKGTSNNTGPLPKLVGLDSDEAEFPLSVFQILQQTIDCMLDDQAISIVSFNKVLNTQEAADLLNVSQPFLASLLDTGVLPSIEVDAHRRIRFTDLIEYKKRRDEERRRGLAEITHISEDADLYD